MSNRAKQLSNTVPADAFDVAVEMLNREQRRSRRKRDVRARTISIKRMTKRELAIGAALYPTEPSTRPSTRGECEFIERPCPYVSCRHHLYLDVSPKTGAIKLNFPDIEPDQMIETCCLDVADRGGATLEQVAEVQNLTRERVRQVETKAFRRLLNLQSVELAEHAGEAPRKTVRHIPEEA